MVTYEEFRKIQLRVAVIETAEKVAGTDKLLKLTVNLGNEKRTLAAGIAQHYAPETLIGKKIIVVTNLEPRTVRGVLSQGMLLAAVQTKPQEKISLITVEGDIPPGTEVM